MDSKLQIISGAYRGRKLKLPPHARPTQNRARIALFNMLESGVLDGTDNLVVWDAFAGSGAFGLECLSRYPNARVTFTDTDATSIKTVRDNLKVLDIDSRATATQTDALGGASKYGADADLVFIDAPYSEHGLGNALVSKLSGIVKTGTIVIWEQEVCNKYTPNDTTWTILRDKQYGRARFLILRKK